MKLPRSEHLTTIAEITQLSLSMANRDNWDRLKFRGATTYQARWLEASCTDTIWIWQPLGDNKACSRYTLEPNRLLSLTLDRTTSLSGRWMTHMYFTRLALACLKNCLEQSISQFLRIESVRPM